MTANFVIYLPEYQTSVSMANVAVDSGRRWGWDISLHAGVDGSKQHLSDFGITVNAQDAKCRTMLERPGVGGCFLSHWKLWNLCIQLNQVIGIFEHDIEFVGARPNTNFDHVLKLEGFLAKKPRPAGTWYEGARAYLLTPAGARRLVQWTAEHGALPADVAIGSDVVNITLDQSLCVKQHELYGKTDKRSNSFTWNLEGMK